MSQADMLQVAQLIATTRQALAEAGPWDLRGAYRGWCRSLIPANPQERANTPGFRGIPKRKPSKDRKHTPKDTLTILPQKAPLLHQRLGRFFARKKLKFPPLFQ